VRRTAAFRPRRTARALAPIGVLALVAVLAAGCSDDSDGDDESEDEPDAKITALTDEQIAEAVLQDDNLGEGWASEPATDDDSVGPGCFGDIDTLTDGLEEKAKGGTEFAYGETELPYVESTITAYGDDNAITAVFDQVQTVLGGCSTVSDTDEDGGQWDLTLTYDESATYDDVDDQFHLTATGTFLQSGATAPTSIIIDWTTVRVGPNVGTVTTIDTQPRATEHAVWAEIAVERLTDVAEGEEPEATTAPAPAAPAA
jgi:hypothetical protein